MLPERRRKLPGGRIKTGVDWHAASAAVALVVASGALLVYLLSPSVVVFQITRAGNSPVHVTGATGTATAGGGGVAESATGGGTPVVQHIVWVLMESQSYTQISGNTTDAPYINNTLIHNYGSATNFNASYHPSLPNYLDLTQGTNNGVTDDNTPAAHPQSTNSIFSQLPGGLSKSEQQAMGSNCQQTGAGSSSAGANAYAVRHNPEAYYTNVGGAKTTPTGDCASYDIPLNVTTPDLSAKLTFITPDTCHDMHVNFCTGGAYNNAVCPGTTPGQCAAGETQQGDNFLSTFIPTLLNSSTYQAGHTAIFITWDEGPGTGLVSSHVPTIIIDPFTGNHDTSTCQGSAYTHGSILKYAEDTFGAKELSGAAAATSMNNCFGLPTPGTTTSSTLCGQGGTAPATYSHVIWILFENQTASNIYGNPTGNTPYWNTLTQQCGSATNMHGVFKPSAPNYVALASGSNQGLTTDGNPTSGGQFAANNIFNQVKTAGGTWREYASRMPNAAQGGGNCWVTAFPTATTAYYTPHHMPAPYFSDIHADCLNWDIPLKSGETGTLCGAASSTAGATTIAAARNPANCADTTSGALATDLTNNTLPTFTVISPADDGGNATLGGEVDPQLGDAFTQRWIAKIQASTAYQSGSTAIFITWDENGCFTTACKADPTTPLIPTIVIAPTIPAGAVSTTSFNLYNILHTTQLMLGLPTNLTTADTNAASMRAAFNW